MHIWNSMAGMIRAEIISADPIGTMQQLNSAQIELFDVVSTSDLTVQLSFSRRHLQKVKKILKLRGDRFRIRQNLGIFWKGKILIKRPVFLSGCLLLILLALSMPTRIFFVTVEGNTQLPAQLILEKAEQCGIRFGVTRREVRSEKMKNALLAAIPQLQWAGINTSGCVATICVEEKEVTDTRDVDTNNVSSIVASRDGIITSCTVLKGNLLCQQGQAVKAGQMLVSGYTDCGLTIQATQAEAEISAQTFRTMQVVSPTSSNRRGDIAMQETKYSLLIGKKLINFYKDSGICDATCAKIYKQEYLTMPGGFALPVALITETWTYYKTQTVACQAEDYSWIDGAAQQYLMDQMVAGEILLSDTSMQLTDSLCYFQGRYTCIEMIGQVKDEENILDYGEYYGEDR